MFYKFVSILLITTLFYSCNDDNIKTSNTEELNLIDYYKLKKVKGLNIDSLYNVSSLLSDDTIKVNELLNTYKLTINHRPIRLDILNKALRLSRDLNYVTGIANCLKDKGLYYRYNHEYIKAIKYHKEALDYYKRSWDTRSRIKNLNSLGVAYRRINVEDEAIKYYFRALRLSEKEEHSKSMAIALNGIGNAYVILKEYDNAIKYFKLSLNFEKLINSVRGTGYDYSNLGEAYMYKEEYDTSFYYHRKALEVANKLNIENDKAIIYSSIGLMYQHKGDLDFALKYYLDAIPTLEKYKSKRLLSFSLINVGEIYKDKGDYKKADSYINKGLLMSESISSKDNIVSGYDALSRLNESTGDYKTALGNYKQMVIFRDSIFNIKSDYNVAAMNIKYETKKKDDKIERLSLEGKVQQSKIVIQFLVIAILFVLALFFVLYNRIRVKNQNLVLKNMRHQIEDHLVQISSLKKKDVTENSDVLCINKGDYELSLREEEVLLLIAQGLKNQEIADKMFVSLSTIKTHTKNIFEKMDVRNRIEAANKANAL